MIARFRETISTVKSVSPSEIYKNSGFSIEITILPFFRKLEFSRVLHVWWVVGSQLHIEILCKIEYLEMRWEEQSRNLYGQDHTFPSVMIETIGSKSGPSISSSGMSVHS